LKPNQPLGLRFYERVDNGDVPPISLEGMRQLDAYLQEALAMPDTKLGSLPARAVKATEIVQAMQASGSLYESLAARFEDSFLEPLFEKCWKLVVQYIPSFLEEEIVQILGARNTLLLEDLSAAERWKLLHKATFKVRGLRGVAAKEREFNKLMTLVNLLSSNPQFADAFGRTYSYDKLFARILRASGNDPSMLELDEPIEEQIDTGNGSEPAEGEAGAPPAGAPPTMAAGQLNPALPGASGASPPNIPAQADQGAASAFAPNNPNAGGGA
jgi:hypothetical protein